MRPIGWLTVPMMALLAAGCTGDPQEPTAPESPAPLGAEALLTADQMPAWNNAIEWRQVGDADAASALGVCALPTAAELGALEVEVRSFEAADGATQGVNEVARFADWQAAGFAISSWEDAMATCAAGPFGDETSTATQMSELVVGSTWTVSAPLPATGDEGRFEFVGFSAVDATTTLVGFSIIAQDANWDSDPLADSMAAARARIS